MLLESVGCIMKKNRRVLTVNGNQYVWWRGIGEGFTSVILSPFEDKTSKVKVEFRDAVYQSFMDDSKELAAYKKHGTGNCRAASPFVYLKILFLFKYF